MKLSKVLLFGHIPAGTLVWLSEAQARDRAHSISEAETSKSMKDRKLYSANELLGFKAGEELAIEGDLDRGLEAMFGIAPASADDKAAVTRATAEKKLAEKVSAAEGKVVSIKAEVDIETAAVAAADDAGKPAAQGKLDKAKGALAKAEAELAKLKG